ncbi:hypothetical protein SAMN04488065_1539 [Haloplanus vescus]|uniref:Uncharacterized protein n=1 Tax=Haloplanus vescus TaxID=555874 RepID=A0A1H3XHP4_9EURY|nr:hypothetical protein [Haloplanus vescus]SDZ98174.1 hypothetical protein SAMN04488065_1539 [Haloplanus vescus]
MSAKSSLVLKILVAYTERMSRAVDRSRLMNLVELAANRTTKIVRNSWIYNWLTAEPEPEIIVIDLRETRTVGPVIALLDLVIEMLVPWYRQSALKRGINSVITLGERAAETRVGKLVIALFEPPELPEERSGSQDKYR